MATAPNSSSDEEFDTAARLRTAVTRLHRRLRQQSLGGLSPGQASTLAMITRLGTPTLGALAKAEQIQPPSMTRLIAGMEETGLVSRAVEEQDRRISRVSLTTKGRRELERVRTMKTAYLVERLSGLSPAEKSKAVELVELLERIEEDQ